MVGVATDGSEVVIGEMILGSRSGKREVASESGLDGQEKERNGVVLIG